MKFAEAIEERKEVFSALASVQGAIDAAKKESSGQVGNQKYKYADLGAVIEASQKAMRENGLALTFNLSTPDRAVTLVPYLIHKSGQMIEFDSFTIPCEAKAQAQGSAITYGRRYLTQAILGIPSEDDDGNEATAGAPKPGPKAADRPSELSSRPTSDPEPEGQADERLQKSQREIIKMFAEFSIPKDELGFPLKTWMFSEDDLAQLRTKIEECTNKRDLLALYDKTNEIKKARARANFNAIPTPEPKSAEAIVTEEQAGDLFDQPQETGNV